MHVSEVTNEAITYVRSHKSVFINHVLKGASAQKDPVAVFMAGTPGAGKSEVARSITDLFETEPVIIDADEFRGLIPGYNGKNSSAIQPAAALAVDKVFDVVKNGKISFILDGTFAIGKSIMNIKRVVRNNFTVHIYYVYQDPKEAWEFTKVREEKEGRHVPKSTFIDAYYKSRENVKLVKGEFGEDVLLQVLVKSYNKNEETVYTDVQDLDKVLPILYNRDELEEILNG